MVSSTDCLFCKIVRGEIPSHKVYEDEDNVAFLDINPTTPGHTLVLPKRHFENILDVEDAALCKLILAVKKVAQKTKIRLDVDSLNVMQNTGRMSGQSIDHIHFHVVPRYTPNDMRIISQRVELSEQQFEEIVAKLK